MSNTSFFESKERAKFLSLWFNFSSVLNSIFCLGFWILIFGKFSFWLSIIWYYYIQVEVQAHGRCPWNLFEDTKGDFPFCLSRKIQIELYRSNLIFFHFYKPTNLLSAILNLSKFIYQMVSFKWVGFYTPN